MSPINGVLLTTKCVAINSNLNLNTLPKLRPAPLVATTVLLKGGSSPSSSGYASSSNSVADEDTLSMASTNVAGPTKAKKRRLDHLSWEEKVQRKKLKNRVAAQTSRDRKKARMEEMEYELNELTEKSVILQNKCESLQSINESLLAKNHKLDTEVELLRQELAEVKELATRNHSNSNNNNSSNSHNNNVSVNANAEGCASTNTGSAASNADPLQQGTQVDTQSSAHALTSTMLQQQQHQLKQSNSTASLWRIVALCLLYKTCCSSTMKSSMRDDLKSWPKVCSQISQQTWKQAVAHAAKLLPKMQASQSDCLDQWWGPQQSAWNPAEIELMA